MLAALLGPGAVQSLAEWSIAPRLGIAGGHESDLFLDTSLDLPVVEGGNFLQLGPGLTLQRRLSDEQLLRLYGGANFERYLNDRGRLRSAGWIWAEWLRRQGSWQTRVAGGGRFFDDSQRDTVRRFGGNAELGVGYVQPRWSLELSGGPQGRRYPDYDVPIEVIRGRGMSAQVDTVLVTYSETGWSSALEAAALPHSRLLVRGEMRYASIDARDDAFDSRGWSTSGRMELRLHRRLKLLFAGGWQSRSFVQRDSLDSDRYVFGSAGLRVGIRENLQLELRYGYGRYQRPTGEEEDSGRIELGISLALGPYGPGADRGGSTEELRRLLRQAQALPVQEDPGMLRLHAPGAARVAVAGDFNGWNPELTVLQRVEGGWWQIRLELPPGVYQYAYVVDGVWTTPPEALRTVEDGFGGRNGILEILASP